MKFRFIGTYSGAETIDAGGVTFTGREPAEVTNEATIRRLRNHVEFEAVDALDHDGDGKKGGSLPKKRGRKPKADG